eukprot:4115002-Prymnesium_polylepis.2
MTCSACASSRGTFPKASDPHIGSGEQIVSRLSRALDGSTRRVGVKYGSGGRGINCGAISINNSRLPSDGMRSAAALALRAMRSASAALTSLAACSMTAALDLCI